MPFRLAQTLMRVIPVNKLGVEERGTPFATTWITSNLQALPPVRLFSPSFLVSSECALQVWISPVSQNYEGPRSPYGDPYHGYWVADASQLNSRFGTSDDLKALSNDLHRRNM